MEQNHVSTSLAENTNYCCDCYFFNAKNRWSRSMFALDVNIGMGGVALLRRPSHSVSYFLTVSSCKSVRCFSWCIYEAGHWKYAYSAPISLIERWTLFQRCVTPSKVSAQMMARVFHRSQAVAYFSTHPLYFLIIFLFTFSSCFFSLKHDVQHIPDVFCEQIEQSESRNSILCIYVEMLRSSDSSDCTNQQFAAFHRSRSCPHTCNIEKKSCRTKKKRRTKLIDPFL